MITLDRTPANDGDVFMSICEICNTRESNGTVGHMDDRTKSTEVCSYCYHNVLKMTPLVDLWLKDLKW